MARIARRRRGREPARDPWTSTAANTIEHETRFYITSLVWIAAQIGPAIRAHWMIENGLHSVLDMNFPDDECRVRTDHAPANFTTIKHVALNLIRRAPGKDSTRLRREVEPGETPGPAEEVLDLGEAAHELDDPVRVECADAAVVTGEVVGLVVGGCEQLVETRVGGRGEQRAQIPHDVVGGNISRGHGEGSYCAKHDGMRA